MLIHCWEGKVIKMLKEDILRLKLVRISIFVICMNCLKSSTLMGEVRIVCVRACLCVQCVVILPHRMLPCARLCCLFLVLVQEMLILTEPSLKKTIKQRAEAALKCRFMHAVNNVSAFVLFLNEALTDGWHVSLCFWLSSHKSWH